MKKEKNKELNLKNIFKPDLKKLCAFLILAITFWFFPIITSSIFAKPFVNFESFSLALAINLATAYLLSCLIIQNAKQKKVLLTIILIFLIIYLAIPKISYYSIGDLGGVKQKYCECYGYSTQTLKCCYSHASYCNGPCLRAERKAYWRE